MERNLLDVSGLPSLKWKRGDEWVGQRQHPMQASIAATGHVCLQSVRPMQIVVPLPIAVKAMTGVSNWPQSRL